MRILVKKKSPEKWLHKVALKFEKVGLREVPTTKGGEKPTTDKYMLKSLLAMQNFPFQWCRCGHRLTCTVAKKKHAEDGRKYSDLTVHCFVRWALPQIKHTKNKTVLRNLYFNNQARGDETKREYNNQL